MYAISDKIKIWLTESKKTSVAGLSLAHTLYSLPLTISLRGALGSGKTTFMQGFAKGLGVTVNLTSPTYALEQRYLTEHHGELLHIDLFRISNSDAISIIDSSEIQNGIRCIEWSDKIIGLDSDIGISLAEDPADRNSRILECKFKDIRIPSREDVEEWRNELRLTNGAIKHCDAVAAVTGRIAKELLAKGIILRPLALIRAAELHDLFRFVDFRADVHKSFETAKEEDKAVWRLWKNKLKSNTHESACKEFLKEKGYPEIGTIIERHGLNAEDNSHMTIEQKILLYADKRVMKSEVVSVDERFNDFRIRYGGGKETELHRKWMKEVKRIEKELFGGETPF